MGRQYSLEDAKAPQYLAVEGRFLVKVLGVTQGKTQNNNATEKVWFITDDGFQISDEFFTTPNALHHMKTFVEALGLPLNTDTDHWVNQKVIITVKKEFYPKNDGTQGEKFVIAKYEPNIQVHQVPNAL